MYIIMYKYSTFRINHKSFRSCMSKNFTVIPGFIYVTKYTIPIYTKKSD